ncbi:O-linked N-acetylglucosamine transferase family protein [Paraburkholderia kirstenboschensis]|uniref:protein O-GlcNAc transferase n=1 Tax=Paraburkholderia kirstenboschensis TaxID=1245436 RepID=A0ABZ0EMU6_9BURK|nr:tetratricopeptide repeat protein [Paraburkholderia kirstenboschensis]WOD17916.1 tetratricopeptide repeat protein [Paraburkholderia kirstenboschensis]
MQAAIAEHQNGALDSAEMLYRTILEARPHYGDANYNLGLVAVQRGQFEAALPHLEAAVGGNPDQGQYWASYIDALRRAGQTSAGWLMLEVAQQRGLRGSAVDALVHLLAQTEAHAPASPPVISVASNVAHAEPDNVGAVPQSGSTPTSSKQRTTATRGAKNSAPSPRQMEEVVMLFNSGRIAEAAAAAQSLTKHFPTHPIGWRVLGVAMHALGRHDDAVEPLRQAVELDANDIQAGGVLADILRMNGAFDEAEGLSRRLLALNPVYVEAHRVLGMILHAQGRLGEAEASCRRAIELWPDASETHNTLGTVHLDQGRTLDAEACFRRALEIQPDNAFAHHNILFCLSHNREIDAAALFAQHCHFAQQFEAPLRPAWPRHTNPRDPARQLRIGLVSADLFHHAVSTFVEPVLAHLAGNEHLSLHVYYNFTREDQITQRLHGYVSTWQSVWGMSDAALAEKIRADGIDILIDLSGHTARNRLLTFARKPAPIQASWIGYPGTTGLAAVDYYLADRFLVPAGFEDQFTEKIARLPAVAPFQPPAVSPPINLLPALRNGYVTFGSFNRLNKLHPDVIALWAKLLRALPDARMVVGGMPEDGSDGGLGEWFAAEGIARERLDFRPRAALAAYMQQHHHVDICLDTFPYAGGTTTLHALWMGLPTITLPGSTAASRGGPMSLAQVGLDAFIAQDKEDFVQKGLYWASNLSELAELRTGLRERCAQSAMFQPATIAAGLAGALRVMWQRWCAGEPPVSFDAPLPGHPADTRQAQPVAATDDA